VVLLGLLVASVTGAYRPSSWLRQRHLELVRQLLTTSTVTAWGAVVVLQVSGLGAGLTPLIVFWLVSPITWYAGRWLTAQIRRHAMPERILVIGTGVVARHIQDLCRRPKSASILVGCVDDVPEQAEPDDPPLLGGLAMLPELLVACEIDRVIVAFSALPDHEILEALRNCSAFRGQVDIVPRLFEFVAPREVTYSFDELALLSLPARPVTRGRVILKRGVDIVGSILLLLVLSPLLAVIALAILLDSGRPVLFRQRRVGLDGRQFWILKFRTLRPERQVASGAGAKDLTPGSVGLHVERAKLAAQRRATRVGSFLRRTSLDELPQLLNVLGGQMSLVGPRPLSPSEDAVLSGWELVRRDMRPGITGLWQVSGRDEVSWEDRINLDYRQVRHWSLSLDLHVLADTIRAILRHRGAE
jgi:exopolysaccharide biosynthesis polyprenyl glycosylphosphotransferase